MHAGVELDMDRIVSDTIPPGLRYHILKHRGGVDFRLEMIAEHLAVVGHPGIHHHDGHRYAATAQIKPLIEHGHCQIGGTCILQRLGYLVAPCAISGGLHHGYHAA